jgi:2',3'-cyclic-nucleotide 2'-phosphodiesterase (5'-nucleotidase family)
MALMPFDNTIIATELDGATVRTVVETGTRPVVGGLIRRGNRWVLSASGEELGDDKTYRVLVNSFMYAGGDGYNIIPETDPDGFDTGINYRQPFQDWLPAQNTSEQNPLRLN